MPDFVFNEEKHQYLLDGQELPGTTKILTDAGLIDFSFMSAEKLQWYLDKGNAVHLATELWDRDELDEDTVDPEIVGRLEAWKRFRLEIPFEIQGIEIPLYHPLYRYGVKPDRWGIINGKLTLVEIKPANQEPWHILQRAANRASLVATGTPIVHDLNVYLSDDGTYKLSKCSSGRKEASEFFTLATSFWIKEKYK